MPMRVIRLIVLGCSYKWSDLFVFTCLLLLRLLELLGLFGLLGLLELLQVLRSFRLQCYVY